MAKDKTVIERNGWKYYREDIYNGALREEYATRVERDEARRELATFKDVHNSEFTRLWELAKQTSRERDEARRELEVANGKIDEAQRWARRFYLQRNYWHSKAAVRQEDVEWAMKEVDEYLRGSSGND